MNAGTAPGSCSQPRTSPSAGLPTSPPESLPAGPDAQPVHRPRRQPPDQRGRLGFQERVTGRFARMSIIGWIILGLVAGVIAKVLLPGRDPGGLVGTTLIGIVGAFLGGWISTRFLDRTISNDDFFDPA